jgi:outer membrane protein TolC
MVALFTRGRVGVAALLALSGCSPVPYQPHGLDTGQMALDYAKRSTEDVELAQFAAQSGHGAGWPPARWSLSELTTVALYFDPRVRTARAAGGVAQARVRAAGTRESLALTPMIEHHSEQLRGDSPWSLGVALELPWVAQSRREARLSQAAALADAAQLGIAQAVWRSRAGVRDALIELLDARERLALLERAFAVRSEMRGLVARRVEVGMLSARELGQEETLLNELEAELVSQRGRVQAARAALAAACGLPLETLEHMTLADEPLALTAPDSIDRIRAQALRNRLDIQQRLLEFAAADAELKLAVAAQYPELALVPGYLWDQGDSVWSLATRLVLPSTGRVRAQVAQAEAQRELTARRFLELQSDVIEQAQRAWTALASAREQVGMAARQAQAANARLQRVEKLFERGAADRLELTTARLAASASAGQERAAATMLLKALAAAEDVMQQPLSAAAASASGSVQ